MILISREYNQKATKAYLTIILLVMMLSFRHDSVALPFVRTLERSNENVIQDTVIVNRVLKAVSTYIQSTTKNGKRPLAVKDGKKSRRFIIVEILSAVSRNKNVYTVQLDTDEFDHKIPRILYVDVKASQGVYKVTRIRIGPNHFRK